MKEAQRIQTPPGSIRSSIANPRGFFFDLKALKDTADSFSQPGTPMGACTPGAESLTAVPRFEFDVPEHFPKSPLCPANPKHRDGGKGYCIYHGRMKPPVPTCVLGCPTVKYFRNQLLEGSSLRPGTRRKREGSSQQSSLRFDSTPRTSTSA